jgi:hypothetical protein
MSGGIGTQLRSRVSRRGNCELSGSGTRDICLRQADVNSSVQRKRSRPRRRPCCMEARAWQMGSVGWRRLPFRLRSGPGSKGRTPRTFGILAHSNQQVRQRLQQSTAAPCNPVWNSEPGNLECGAQDEDGESHMWKIRTPLLPTCRQNRLVLGRVWGKAAASSADPTVASRLRSFPFRVVTQHPDKLR